jgi:hypothetical protein
MVRTRKAARFKERVTVNVVFVGIEEDEAPWNEVRRGLLSRYEPVVIARGYYGITERLGLDYSLGDESNSMMSYIDVNWDFSQFDRDNSARQHAAGYMMIANRIAADVVRDRDRRRAERDLERADRALRDAQEEIAEHDYDETLDRAEDAYWHVRAAADRAGVKVRVREPSTWTVVGAPVESRIEPSMIDLGVAQNRKRLQR